MLHRDGPVVGNLDLELLPLRPDVDLLWILQAVLSVRKRRPDDASASMKMALDLNPGDTLFVDLKATSGDLKPILMLRDFSKKPIRVVQNTRSGPFRDKLGHF